MDFEKIKVNLSDRGYEYKKFLGKGGFSTVLLCESQKYHQDFAVKRALHHKLSDYEYDYLISLDNPHIIKLYDAFTDPVSQYLVMEYCPNGTIYQKGRLPFEKFIFYAKQILEAVAFCHSKNIAHRDIKPDNIFIDQYDNIKLADFGMAKKFNYYDKSKEKCGSLICIPPEMFICDEINPFKADIWSLGITFYYMATGNYPFTSKNPDELKKMIKDAKIDFFKYKMNPNIILLISKMIEKNPADRLTAEKLLELPIFSNIMKKTQQSSGYKTKSGYKENNTTHSDLFSSNGHSSEILSYRKININPKIDKINRRIIHNTF